MAAADAESCLISPLSDEPVVDRSKLVRENENAQVVDRSNVGEIDLTGLKEDFSTDSNSDDDDVDAQSRNVSKVEEFVPSKVEGDNSQYAGRKFGLIMNINESEYNEGHKMNPDENQLLFGEEISLALTMHND